MEIRGAGLKAEEFPSSFSSFQPNLAAFLLPCRSVRLLDQVVTAGTRHNLDVLHAVEHGSFPDGCAITMEHLRHHPGDGVRCRLAVNVKGNHAVKGGFGLQNAQNYFSNAVQTVGAVMCKSLFGVSREGVNVGEGSSELFHTPYELPFVVSSAS